MIYERPRPGLYVRKTDRAEVTVHGVDGDTVACRLSGPGHTVEHIPLAQFWVDHELKEAF